MQKCDTYDNFRKDLLYLYCNVKLSSVEDLLIRFSASFDRDISTWIKSNRKSLKDNVKDPRVVELLLFLSNAKEMTGTDDKINRSEMMKYLLSSRIRPEYLFILGAFDRILQKGLCKDILFPFANIIKQFTNMLKITGEAPPEGTILQDLISISNLYNRSSIEKIKTNRVTIKDKRRSMVRDLLTVFSNEISYAYESKGLVDISNAIKSGILAKPPHEGIDTILELNAISSDQINESKRLAEQVWKKYDERWLKYNHDMVETTLLNKAGLISNSDFAQIIGSYEKRKNPIDILDETKEIPPWGSEGTEIAVDQRMNPNYIYLLSLFFLYLFRKLSLSPLS